MSFLEGEVLVVFDCQRTTWDVNLNLKIINLAHFHPCTCLLLMQALNDSIENAKRDTDKHVNGLELMTDELINQLTELSVNCECCYS